MNKYESVIIIKPTDKSELEKLIKEKMGKFYNTTYAVDVKVCVIYNHLCKRKF